MYLLITIITTCSFTIYTCKQSYYKNYCTSLIIPLVTDVNECDNATFIFNYCQSPSVCINTPGFYECQRTIGLSKMGEQQLSANNGEFNK